MKKIPKRIWITHDEIGHYALESKYYKNSLEYVLAGSERRKVVRELYIYGKSLGHYPKSACSCSMCMMMAKLKEMGK